MNWIASTMLLHVLYKSRSWRDFTSNVRAFGNRILHYWWRRFIFDVLTPFVVAKVVSWTAATAGRATLLLSSLFFLFCSRHGTHWTKIQIVSPFLLFVLTSSLFHCTTDSCLNINSGHPMLNAGFLTWFSVWLSSASSHLPDTRWLRVPSQRPDVRRL